MDSCDEISGIVKHGNGFAAKDYDFPTANIDCTLDPGFYLGTALDHTVLVVAKGEIAECHLFGFSGDLYGKTLEIKDLKLIPHWLMANWVVGIWKERTCLPSHQILDRPTL